MTQLSRRPALAALLAFAGVAGVIALPQPALVNAQEASSDMAYQVDPTHSTIVFSAKYMGQSPFFGMFTSSMGGMDYDGSDPSSLKIDISAPLSALDTHNETRDGHLRGPDWFDAAEHPNVHFTGSGATANEDGTHTLEGELTLAGVTKPVTVTLTDLASGETPRGQRMGIGGSFTVKRSDFGVTTMMGDSGIGDEITLHFGFQAVAQ